MSALVSERAVMLVAGYAFLLASSGLVVGLVLALISEMESEERGGKAEAAGDDSGGRSGRITRIDRDVGTVIGKCENVLVLTFVLLGAYTALAIIFAAKGIVRREDIRNNTRYYLAGTLVNFTYSVAVSAFVRSLDEGGLVAIGGQALVVGTVVSVVLVGITALVNR